MIQKNSLQCLLDVRMAMPILETVARFENKTVVYR